MDIKNIEFEQDSHGLWDIYVTFEGTDKEVHVKGDEEFPSGVIADLSTSELILSQALHVADEFAQWIEDEKIQRQHDLYDLYNDR